MSNTPDNIVPFIQFNAQAVAGFFDYIPHTDFEEQAMAFLYRMLEEELDGHPSDRIERQKLVTSLTIETIWPLLEKYSLYKRDFPLSTELENSQALSLAIICGDYAHRINEPLPVQHHHNDNDDTCILRDDGFDEIIAGRASYFQDAAKDIVESGLPEDVDRPEPEIIFLAHLRAMEKLQEIEENFHALDNDDLISLLQRDLPAINSFLHPQYAVGDDLRRWCDTMERRVVENIPSAFLPPPRPKPFLFIVPPGGAPAP